ncbi:CPBP family intramembrane glutamic endopeptidase [Neobacillus muris]|uniref:CPBP family intramembrane glutamic endopeptidase n=1 Tax=Neobacillus muris TaxID=2941334 RepID=UPI00203F819A|nr:type II CAAX endopeptidase family protein [Neobacillus muris]
MEGIKQTNMETPSREKIELSLIMALMLMEVLFFPKLKGIMVVVSIIYFLVERRVRNRTGEEIGLSFVSFPRKLRENWIWIALVGVIMQGFYLLMYVNFLPDVLEHLLARVPINIQAVNIQLIFTLLIFAFGEEIVFRGLIQAQLNKFLPAWAAILVTSILFAIMHFSSGPAIVVWIDLTTVFIDSILFGILFVRTNNIYITTFAHGMANLVATFSLYLFF